MAIYYLELPEGIEVGFVIGKYARNVKFVASFTGSRVRVDTDRRVVIIRGAPEAITRARDILDKQFQLRLSNDATSTFEHSKHFLLALWHSNFVDATFKHRNLLHFEKKNVSIYVPSGFFADNTPPLMWNPTFTNSDEEKSKDDEFEQVISSLAKVSIGNQKIYSQSEVRAMIQEICNICNQFSSAALKQSSWHSNTESDFFNALLLSSWFGKEIYYSKNNNYASFGKLGMFSPAELKARKIEGTTIDSHCTPAVTERFGKKLFEMVPDHFSVVEDETANKAWVEVLNQVENSAVRVHLNFNAKGEVSLDEISFPPSKLAAIIVLTPSRHGHDLRLSLNLKPKRKLSNDFIEAYKSIASSRAMWDWKKAKFELPRVLRGAGCVQSFIYFKEELQAYKFNYDGLPFRLVRLNIRAVFKPDLTENWQELKFYFDRDSYKQNGHTIDQLINAWVNLSKRIYELSEQI